MLVYLTFWQFQPLAAITTDSHDRAIRPLATSLGNPDICQAPAKSV